ncbi:hypothetical protein HK098_006947, partial [Nowakowskiella sp. JEL0407]
PYDILLPIYLQSNSPRNLAVSCKFFYNLSKAPQLRFSFVRVYYLRHNYEYVRDLLDRVHGSRIKAALVNFVPTKYRNLLDSEEVCEWASRSNLDLEFIELAWHFAAVSRYLGALRGFVENLERHLQRLDDGSGKAERMLGIRAAYGLKVAIHNSDIEHVKIYLSSDFVCRSIATFLETSEFAATFSPLIYYPDKCSFPLIEEILSKLPIYVSIRDRYRNNALQIALSSRKYHLVRTLILLHEYGIQTTSGTMSSPLRLAIETDDTEILKLILSKLPNDMKLSASDLLLDCARMSSENQLKYVFTTSPPQLIFDTIDFERAVHLAAANCNKNIVSFLVSRCPSAMIALRTSNQTPALFHASTDSDYEEFAGMLLDFGLKRHINRHDSSGITPLHGLLNGFYTKSRYLLLGRFLKLGGDPAVTDKRKGQTSFHHFANCKPIEAKYARWVLELLLKKSYPGAIDLKDDDGFTALGRAVVNAEVRLVKYLLENGADVRLFPTENFPPAILLSRKKNSDVVCIFKMLLSNGMDPNVEVKVKGRRTLLQIARLYVNSKIENMLIRFGAHS